MVMRTDPFREFDRVVWQVHAPSGTWSRPAPMPMDAHRTATEFVLSFDLPGLSPDAIELDVERTTLTVKAERRPPVTGDDVRTLVTERPLGVFSRQVFLGDGLDTDRISATYEAGVLTVRIPLAQQAQPRRITITDTERA
ncbi:MULTISPECIES: Hsp20/alpha crystallin family protein [Amycolatopsis]|uniref:HSP20 family protein n=2 Tax=Amycolatopsis TaxID=1813 RepID=A0A1I3QVF3_9PSEU|nr:Hsp20/alpha crystallin family protein [Amycolatopsis sacchari]SFJ38124.1 HSP20 family protein [Amycolatopsis sacchari]